MKKFYDYIIYKIAYKDLNISYNILRFGLLLAIILIYSIHKIKYDFEYIFFGFAFIISISFTAFITIKKKIIFKNLKYSKYYFLSSSTFLMCNQLEQKEFFNTIKNHIIENDLKYERKKNNLFLDKINTLSFRKSIVSELDFERFKNEIKNSDESILIRDIFSYKKDYQNAITIINEKMKLYKCDIDELIIFKINNILINNINIYSNGVALDIIKLKLDMDDVFFSINTENQPRKNLDEKKNKLLSLILPFFPFDKNIEKIVYLIDSKIYKLIKGDLLFHSRNTNDAGRILMLLHQKRIISKIDLETIYIQGFLSFNKSKDGKETIYSNADMLKSHKNLFLKNLNLTTSKNPNITKLLEEINRLYRS